MFGPKTGNILIASPSGTKMINVIKTPFGK